MLSQGLNAQRFTLPDSSEPNILKAQRLNQERRHIRGLKTGTYRSKDNRTENRTTAVRSPNVRQGTFWTCVVTVLCRLFGNHRFTFLITLPLVLAYLVRKYFPSARMPTSLIGMSCTTMGVICSCALPDLFAPLSAINCNADYYVSLCGRTEAAPTETVPTYNNALFGPATSAQFPLPPPAATATTTTTQSEQEFPIFQVPLLLDSPSRNFLPLDFGLANNGAKVLPALTSPTEGSSPLSYVAGLISVLRGYDKTQMHMNPPRVVLEEEIFLSNCWKFAGSQGHIAIALSDSIIWNQFTIHFPDGDPGINLRQAPRVIVMQALVSQENILVEARSLQTAWEDFVVVDQLLDPSMFNSSMAFMEVARIVYMPLEGGQQMFTTFSPVQTSVVLVQILDNWGDMSTCLHRISFHGDTLD